MRKSIVLFLTVIFGAVALEAQPFSSFFQPLTWEQASLIAARENKLVLVEVGPTGKNIDKVLEKHRDLSNVLLRNVVAIRVDSSTSAGKEFEVRLLMNPLPVFAFFMPYGDLVGTVAPDEVERDAEVLRDALQKAQQVALIKKSNSRSVGFSELSLERALSLAAEEDKNLFVYVRDSHSRSSLLVERNVLNLDKVADFFNQHFINLSLNKNQAEEWLRHYPVRQLPTYLFLNPQGKLLYRAEGYADAEQLTGYGNAALEKARGIPFEPLDAGEAGVKARLSGKLVFTDHYVPGKQHRELQRAVFSAPEVTDLFSAHFVNVSCEDEQAFLQFSDASGKELHRVLGVADAEDLLKQAKMVLAGRGVSGMAEEYRRGNREEKFVEEYLLVLERADRNEEASQVAMAHLASFAPDCLKEKRYWALFDRYVRDAESSFFDYLLEHRTELAGLYGGEEVNREVTDLWLAGAGHFVRDGHFDEAGFKEYAKRLRKEKVDGWRQIVRNARMQAAEQTGDWKTFITLAEEKWHEEHLTDAELYRWGMKIDECCRDEGVRYKMAQWLAGRALQIQRNEQVSGKVKVTSYRGFFEKLANDLLRKK